MEFLELVRNVRATRRLVIRLAAFALFCLASPVASAEAPPFDETDCAPLAIPDTPRAWSASFTTQPRGDAERILRANILTRRDEDGGRAMVTRITHPEDLAGSRLFLLERDGTHEIFLETPELGRPRRITGSDASRPALGTDFSYEDLERLYGMNRPGETRRLEDSELDGRPVRVLSITPAGPDASAYSEVRAFVDPETCIPLRMEFLGDGGRMRKLLTIDPRELRRDGATYVAHRLRMRDLDDGSETRLILLGQRPAAEFPELPRGGLE